MKRKYLIIIGVVLVIAFLGYPVNEDCLDGKECGALTVTSENPRPNKCVGVVNRPLIAKILGVNWYYGFDASDDVAKVWCAHN